MVHSVAQVRSVVQLLASVGVLPECVVHSVVPTHPLHVLEGHPAHPPPPPSLPPPGALGRAAARQRRRRAARARDSLWFLPRDDDCRARWARVCTACRRRRAARVWRVTEGRSAGPNVQWQQGGAGGGGAGVRRTWDARRGGTANLVSGGDGAGGEHTSLTRHPRVIYAPVSRSITHHHASSRIIYARASCASSVCSNVPRMRDFLASVLARKPPGDSAVRSHHPP